MLKYYVKIEHWAN